MPFFLKRTLLVAVACLPMASVASAQCATCPQPTVAYAPVAQPPAVYQTTVVNDGWYPGKFLGRALTWPFRATANALTTPIAPAYPPATYQSVGYRAPYQAAYPMTSPMTSATYTAAYAPTYPPTYTAAYAPTYSVARPVTLAPVASSCCDPCTACTACGSSPCACGGQVDYGVSQAGYDAPSSSCPNCTGGGAIDYGYSDRGYSDRGYSDQGYNDSYQPAPRRGVEPTPAIPPGQDVPEQRRNYPPNEDSVMPDNDIDVDIDTGDPQDQTSWFEAPRLFNPTDRSAQRRVPQNRTQTPTAPVWTAVYRERDSAAADRAAVRQTSYHPTAPATPPRTKQVGASGWRSTGR